DQFVRLPFGGSTRDGGRRSDRGAGDAVRREDREYNARMVRARRNRPPQWTSTDIGRSPLSVPDNFLQGKGGCFSLRRIIAPIPRLSCRPDLSGGRTARSTRYAPTTGTDR